MAKSVIRNCP